MLTANPLANGLYPHVQDLLAPAEGAGCSSHTGRVVTAGALPDQTASISLQTYAPNRVRVRVTAGATTGALTVLKRMLWSAGKAECPAGCGGGGAYSAGIVIVIVIV